MANKGQPRGSGQNIPQNPQEKTGNSLQTVH
jgi:hypothetical protein